jgi:hypothetical protein
MLVSALNRWNIDHNVITGSGNKHKGGHKHHPCTLWVGENLNQFEWTLRLSNAISSEYTKRYKKSGLARTQLNQILETNWKEIIPDGNWTEPPKVLSKECDIGPTINSYKAYLIKEKSYMAKWNYSKKPSWWY